jgi:hypothetical protein
MHRKMHVRFRGGDGWLRAFSNGSTAYRPYSTEPSIRLLFFFIRAPHLPSEPSEVLDGAAQIQMSD